ncbi:MAG: GTPase Era [Bacteroidia bacterium]|nr:GTPase Era [Bacteroidia bacterium]
MTRAGFIALLGEPNAGKSTLFNRLIQTPLAAITPKPQTTRFCIPGILQRGDSQYVFVDTPGWISQPRNEWHRLLTKQSLEAGRNADICIWVCPPSPSPPPPEIDHMLRSRKVPLFLVCTHLDSFPPDKRNLQLTLLMNQLRSYPIQQAFDLSVDQPLDLFLDTLSPLLPESPFLYPPEDITPLPIRFFVSEILRRQIYQHLREELPYSTEVEITTYREEEGRDYIAATVYVEKESQKPILIGEKGRMIKKIGTKAREEIEKMIDKPVFLDLRVKVSRNWRNSAMTLQSLGYRSS